VGGQGLGHLFEGLAGRLDPDEPLENPGPDHQHGPEQVAVHDVDLLLGLDQLAEQQRAGHPADAGADGVEEGQGHPAGGQGGRRQGAGVEQQPGADQQHPRGHTAQGDHGLAADVVEQPPQQQRPEQVPEDERDDVGGYDVVLDPEEGAEHQRLGEEHGVVDERLADEQGQAEHGPLGVALEGGVGDDPEADAVPLADLERVAVLLELLAGLLLDPPLDVGDQLLGLVVVAVDEQPAGALGDVATGPAGCRGRGRPRDRRPAASPG
jgi:hypothetical protein